GGELALVAGERAGDEGGAAEDGQGAGVEGRQIVDDPVLLLGAQVGGGRKLAFGQAVDAVVFDDVDQRQIAAHEMDELADTDGGGIAVAADAQRLQAAVGQHGAGGYARHAAVDGVEPEGAAEEVRGRLAGAADAAELDEVIRLDAHLVAGINDALADGVVAAAGA